MPSSIPSLRYHFLTPFYDFLFRVLLPAEKIRKTLLNTGTVAQHSTIVEIGCGTGSFTTMLAKKNSISEIIALDMDNKALSILKDKVSESGLKNIVLQKASATQLPFDDESIDVVYSSLLFCNLNYEDKLKTIVEAKRTLKNHAQFLIADWSRPLTFISKVGFTILEWVGGKANTEDMKKGMLKNYLKDAGFEVSVEQSINTLFGTIHFYKATKIK